MKIKTSVKLLLAAFMVLPLVLSVPVFAQRDDMDEPVSNQTTTDQGAQKTREQRIMERKDKLERRLTQVEQNVVKTRCRAANGLIKASQARLSSFVAKRTRVYSGLVERLESLSSRLQAAGVDTKTYDEQVGVLKGKAEAYGESVTTLQQAVDDLATMDCTADPEGFVASLQEAIRMREDVIAKGQDFRTYLKTTLKPTLTAIHMQLKDKEGEE
jgi:hypothetical protein